MAATALIAMSGGVDSTVAALLAKSGGLECTGVTMRLMTADDEAERDAALACARLGIPHTVIDMSGIFRREVVERFVGEYAAGRTPNPCIDCNRLLKFGALLSAADDLGLHHIVTGHYAQIGCDGELYTLKKALDPHKDQSYFLYSLTQRQLSRALFPLGGMTKADVRALASAHGFANAGRRESQDICFIPDGDYASFIERFTGKSSSPGNFIDTSGNVIGRHRGVIHYTPGQRKGLGISHSEPLYVASISPADNAVTLAEGREIMFRTVIARDVNIISGKRPDGTIRASVKLRHRQREQPASVSQDESGTLTITFDEPQRAPAPGQSAVIYDGDTVIGGGKIERAI